MSIRQSGLCVHPQQTVIHPRHAAGQRAAAVNAHTHPPTVPHLTATHHPQTAGQLAAVFSLS